MWIITLKTVSLETPITLKIRREMFLLTYFGACQSVSCIERLTGFYVDWTVLLVHGIIIQIHPTSQC